MGNGATGDRDAQGRRGKRGTARVQGGGWGALERGAGCYLLHQGCCIPQEGAQGFHGASNATHL